MTGFADIAKLRQELDDVEAALSAARSGSSYSIGGRTLTRQGLAELRDERTRLIRDIRSSEAALEGARNPGAVVATWGR